MAKSNTVKGSERGAAAYHPWLLSIYDWMILGVFSRYAWGCPTVRTLLPFFRENVSDSHLDVGVGTGYFLANSSLSEDASIMILDLNQNSLDMARARLNRSNVTSLKHDIFLPLDPAVKYKSISLFYFLHCLPGPPSHKMALFDNLRENVTPEGIVYGTTVLGKGVRHNLFGKVLMAAFNKKGVFDNREDSEEELTERLKAYFERVETKVVGRVLMFKCRGPKSGGSLAKAQQEDSVA